MSKNFSSRKREELHRAKYRLESEFLKAVDNYMDFYNINRPYHKLKYRTLEQAEADFWHKEKAAEYFNWTRGVRKSVF